MSLMVIVAFRAAQVGSRAIEVPETKRLPTKMTVWREDSRMSLN